MSRKNTALSFAFSNETYDTLQEKMQAREVLELTNTLRMLRTLDGIAVKYHETNIVIFHANGRVSVRNGGYFTPSTIKNMNIALNGIAHIAQKSYAWYLDYDGYRYNFTSGMAIDTANKRVYSTYGTDITQG